MRTLLRLEDLYERVEYFLRKTDAAGTPRRAAVAFSKFLKSPAAPTSNPICCRNSSARNTRSKRCATTRRFREEALDNILWQIDQASSRLFQTSGKVGQELRENEWLMSIKQRTNIPGGVCEFDLPSYHYWLQQNPSSAATTCSSGWRRFCRSATRIAIVLRLLRESGKAPRRPRYQGIYQQMMAGRVAQMLRIRLSPRLSLRARNQRQQIRAQHPLHHPGRRAAAQGRRNGCRVRTDLLQSL